MLILLFVLCTCKMYSQVFFDAVDHKPIFELSQKNGKINVKYYLSTDTLESIDHYIDFNGGVQALNRYCDSLYYASFTEETYKEVNLWESYCILFDNKLRIRDVRVIDKPPAYTRIRPYSLFYDTLIKRIIYSTEGRWSKKKRNNHWSFYIGLFHLK